MKRIGVVVLLVLLSLGVYATKYFDKGEASAVKPELKIGWTPWADAELITKLARRIIEYGYDVKVELVMASIGVQFQAVGNDSIQLMLMAWLPITHKNYWDKTKDKVDKVGPLYTGNLGLAVPKYTSKDELKSVDDLNKSGVKAKLNNIIQGIDPGAGLMQITEEAISVYGLDYSLRPASSVAMQVAAESALKKQAPIAITLWSPHPLGTSFYYLEDPKGVFGEQEEIYALISKGFSEKYPEVAGFLQKFKLAVAELEYMLAETDKYKKDKSYRGLSEVDYLDLLSKFRLEKRLIEGESSYRDDAVEKAISDFLLTHAEKVEGWLGKS